MNVYEAKRIIIPEGSVKRILDSNNVVIWKKPVGFPEPFYVENITNSAETVTIDRRSGAPDITIETSTDGRTWTTLGTTSDQGISFSLPVGSKVYMRANANAWCGQQSPSQHNYMRGFSKVGGNIMSLLYGSNFTGEETTFPGNYNVQFCGLLISNHTLLDASDLVLPVTTLTNTCYREMFSMCRSLTTGPKKMMAKTMGQSSCMAMFLDCTSLEDVTVYADDISANSCLQEWFEGASSTGTFHNLGSATYPTGTSGIPSGWTEVKV